MKLTVLGSGSACMGPGQAGSGYLVEEGEAKLLLECGPGVLGRLQKHAAPGALTAIVISHMHPDHCIDLLAYRQALRLAPHEAGAKLPPLYLPPGGMEVLNRVAQTLDPTGGPATDDFRTEEYSQRRQLRIGGLALRFFSVKHTVPAWAMVVEGERRLVFSGDTGPCPELTQAAHQADLFLCEATFQGAEKPLQWWGHMSAMEAGLVARRANARRLLLTHIAPHLDVRVSLGEARESFRERVEYAEEARTFTL